MYYKISPEKVAEFQAVHSLLSLGQDGIIKFEQLEFLMELLDHPLDKQELDWVRRKVITKGELNFDLFMHIMIMDMVGIIQMKVRAENEDLPHSETRDVLKEYHDEHSVLLIDGSYRGEEGLMEIPIYQFWDIY